MLNERRSRIRRSTSSVGLPTVEDYVNVGPLVYPVRPDFAEVQNMRRYARGLARQGHGHGTGNISQTKSAPKCGCSPTPWVAGSPAAIAITLFAISETNGDKWSCRYVGPTGINIYSHLSSFLTLSASQVQELNR